ncbi:Galactose transporter [Piscirickettsia salmonis]|uniref:MFS transporter, sugar porter family protein n=1 Tax=Piscirickettsia salmonis TaxID=1238 RepID=A0A1L6TCT0_PISSA|nr:sugar porter family MFS transporter [Piscirickettsia salmonis]AKP74284.1 MFS transporter [Piscirickettsia salmonis LF-89 = ATCC VR-1361]ALB23196.1 MFS transporter, sugar porter family protein [Piscirickettsia salmonis]ALY03122.1 MFS transporter [Piscirickettsia salmonis]AMA42681.1 MFS transporter [Piscirickettsia salmonis]AOS35153.1 MFS transporter [Piscirickettsia salmonis]
MATQFSTQLNQQHPPQGKYKFIVYQICIIAALGGLLFGLDIGFIANSLDAIKTHYGLSLQQGEHYAAVLAYGGVVGALLSGIFARFLGRKKSLIGSGLLFTLASIISATLPPLAVLEFCRFMIGFAVGIASFVVPLYLSETAPKRIRGAMGTLFQLLITIGIFLVAVSNVSIIHIFIKPTVTIPLMFLVISAFAVIMFIGGLTLPESPRWLALRGRHQDAKAILTQLRNTQEEVEEEYQEIENNLNTHTHNLSSLSKGYFWKILILCVFIQCFQQLVGINLMIYYSPTIFGYAGMTGIIAMLLVPTVNMLFTFPALKWVEKWGRKKLLYMGSATMFIAMIAAGLSFYTIGQGSPSNLEKGILFISVIVYIFGFAASWGPVAWLLCSELFPQEGREIGITVSTMVNWTFAGLVMSTSLTIMHTFGNSSIFFIFATLCLLSLLFVKTFVPETKNIMLEKIEADLKAGIPLNQLGQGSSTYNQQANVLQSPTKPITTNSTNT